MDLQKLIDTMSDISSQERSNYHLTLGGLIEALGTAEQTAFVIYDTVDEASPSAPQSYRGYYCDLSLPPSSTPITVADLLQFAKEAVGQTFEGYKGGDYEMRLGTPLWASPYGDSNGVAIVDAKTIDGRVFLITKQID